MKLFKYCASPGAAIFETRTIWFTQARFLNDPFELNPSTNLREQDRQYLLDNIHEMYVGISTKGKPPFEDFKKAALQSILEMDPAHKEHLGKRALAPLNDTLAILSLSTTEQNLPMWAHYAEHYSGFVIEFDGDNEFFNPKDGNHAVRIVEYDKKRPWFGLTDNKDELEILYTKSPDWAYEREWRLIRNIQEGSRVETPSGKPAFAFNLPTNCIKSVLLGCRATPALRKRIEGSIIHPDFSHVSLLQTSIHKDDFSLETKPLK